MSEIKLDYIGVGVNEPCCGQPQRCGRDCSIRKQWLGGEFTETQEKNLERLRKAFEEQQQVNQIYERLRKYFEEQQQVNQIYDSVNKPSHYQLLPGVEVIDVRDAIFAKMPVDVPHDVADCWSRSWEYLTRMWGKNGLEDAKKARFYLDRMIQKMEGGANE